MRIAILSDSHGLLRPGIWTHLEGVDRILHAGDVGHTSILDELSAIAPLTAVWGNTDGFEVRDRVPEVAHLELEGHRVVVVHGHQLGFPTPAALAEQYPDASLVAFGHTHRPTTEQVGTLLAVNPGGCGARRHGLPPTLVLATLTPETIETVLVEIEED